jgi:hypothetical protein
MGMFDWLANEPSNSPVSYPAMEARRKIALQLMANRQRKGYPKTLGEGLTAIGDSLAEVGAVRALQQQEAAYQKQASAAAEGAVPGEARATTPPVTRSVGPQSEAEPDERVASAPATDNVPVPRSAEPEPGVADGGFNSIDAAATAPVPGAPGVTPGRFANVRYNNPGAQYPGPSSQAFGSTGTGIIGGGNQIAQFPTPVHGAASNFALLDKGYTGMPVSAAISKWSGGSRSDVPGYDPSAVITPEMVRDPKFAIPFMQAVAGGEAPGKYPMSPEQWQLAHQWFTQGGPGPGEGGPRDRIAAALATGSPQGPPDAQDARLAEVTGMSRGPTGAYSYPSTASLPRTGDVQTDTPNVTGISPRVGAAAADTLQGRPPAPAVPPVNPTLSGPTAPAALPTPLTAATAGSPPEAAGNRPIVVPDIKPVPAAPVPVPGARMAEAPPPTPQRLTPQERMPVPTDIPMTEDEKKGYRIRAQGLALGDQNIQKQGEGLIAYGAGQRKQEYDARLKDWQDQMLERRNRQAAEEKFVREGGALKVQQEAETLKKSQQENALRAQFGNLPPDEVFKQVNASRALAKGAQQALVASRNAMDAFDKGAITGIGANQKLDVAKLFTALNLTDQGDRIRNTEVFRNAMQPIIASILHQTSGTSQLSEGELRFAQRAAAGDITLEPGSIKELMRIIDKRSNEMINDHQTLTGALFGKDNPQANALFGVERPPGTVVEVGSEAEAAKLPVGTKVRINGRTGTVR